MYILNRLRPRYQTFRANTRMFYREEILLQYASLLTKVFQMHLCRPNIQEDKPLVAPEVS